MSTLSDTGNELLILLGMGRSSRPAKAQFPFGYARELYFRTFIVALLLFGGGGATAIYEGILHFRKPEPLRGPFASFVVIAVAAAFDGTSFVLALLAMRRRPGSGPLWLKIHHSKDPAVFAVLIEDFAALLDLAYESKNLLLGENASPRVVADIRDIAARDPRVRTVHTPLTMQLGPHEVLLNLDVEFRDGISAQDHVAAVTSIEDAIRARHPSIRRIFIEARRPG